MTWASQRSALQEWCKQRRLSSYGQRILENRPVDAYTARVPGSVAFNERIVRVLTRRLYPPRNEMKFAEIIRHEQRHAARLRRASSARLGGGGGCRQDSQ